MVIIDIFGAVASKYEDKAEKNASQYIVSYSNEQNC